MCVCSFENLNIYWPKKTFKQLSNSYLLVTQRSFTLSKFIVLLGPDKKLIVSQTLHIYICIYFYHGDEKLHWRAAKNIIRIPYALSKFIQSINLRFSQNMSNNALIGDSYNPSLVTWAQAVIILKNMLKIFGGFPRLLCKVHINSIWFLGLKSTNTVFTSFTGVIRSVSSSKTEVKKKKYLFCFLLK